MGYGILAEDPKQKVLMIFPYGFKYLCLLLKVIEDTNNAVFISNSYFT